MCNKPIRPLACLKMNIQYVYIPAMLLTLEAITILVFAYAIRNILNCWIHPWMWLSFSICVPWKFSFSRNANERGLFDLPLENLSLRFWKSVNGAWRDEKIRYWLPNKTLCEVTLTGVWSRRWLRDVVLRDRMAVQMCKHTDWPWEFWLAVQITRSGSSSIVLSDRIFNFCHDTIWNLIGNAT